MNPEQKTDIQREFLALDGRCVICRKPINRILVLKQTCSDECHEKYIQKLETSFGKFKFVIYNKAAYRVPTRYIAEHGLKPEGLENFQKARCITHKAILEENLDDSSKLDCPVCGYGFSISNPVIWQ